MGRCYAVHGSLGGLPDMLVALSWTHTAYDSATTAHKAAAAMPNIEV